MNKKLLILVAIFTSAKAIFAETQTTSCESKYGTCSFELSDKALITNCVCYDERDFEFNDPFIENFTTLPTEEGCMSKIESLCKISVSCSNDAGECYLEKNDDYSCYCLGVGDKKTGKTSYFGEEGCNELLVEICGSESPTLRKVCPEGILDECVSYFERIHNTCLDPIDIDEILDTPITYGYSALVTVAEFVDCCGNEYWRNEYKRESDCIETFDSCENKECCECIIQVGGVDADDAANTEAPTTGTTPEDTADGDSAPATDSEAPAEKEESKKSDGCSMLFI